MYVIIYFLSTIILSKFVFSTDTQTMAVFSHHQFDYLIHPSIHFISPFL